jgi:hypothetical protein
MDHTCTAICFKCNKLRPVWNDNGYEHSSGQTFHRCTDHKDPLCEECSKKVPAKWFSKCPDCAYQPGDELVVQAEREQLDKYRKMVLAKPTNLLAFEEAWTDPENGRKWLYRYGFCYSYDTYKSLPDAVEYLGVTYVKSGWNSDTGSLAYRQQLGEVLAKPVTVTKWSCVYCGTNTPTGLKVCLPCANSRHGS